MNSEFNQKAPPRQPHKNMLVPVVCLSRPSSIPATDTISRGCSTREGGKESPFSGQKEVLPRFLPRGSEEEKEEEDGIFG